MDPLRDDPEISGVIGTLTALAEDDAGESGEDQIEKGLAKLAGVRAELDKDENIGPMQAIRIAEKLTKAEWALQGAYLSKHSVGHVRAQANNAAAERIREASYGRG